MASVGEIVSEKAKTTSDHVRAAPSNTVTVPRQDVDLDAFRLRRLVDDFSAFALAYAVIAGGLPAWVRPRRSRAAVMRVVPKRVSTNEPTGSHRLGRGSLRSEQRSGQLVGQPVYASASASCTNFSRPSWRCASYVTKATGASAS